MTRFYKTPETLRKGAKSLPGWYYTSDAIFAEEMEKIFSDRWIYVGHIGQIPEPGDYIVRQVSGESLIIVQGRSVLSTSTAPYSLRAFYNVCRHRGSRLCTEPEGHLTGLIRCPYHAWGFDLDGRLLSAPFMDQVEGFDPAEHALKEVAIAIWEGFIFVNLAAQPNVFEQTLFEQPFAPLMGRFTAWDIPNLCSGYRKTYTIQANWKLVIQNYSECYHCSGVHPELSKLSAASSAANELFQGPFLGGPMEIAAPHSSLSLSGERRLPVVGKVSGADLQRAYYYLIFPNLLLSLQPDYVLVHHVEPIAAQQTRVVCDWLVAPEAIAQPNFDPSEIVEFWDRVNQQDWTVCEGMQAGVSSRSYTPGFYSGQESLLAEIDQEVLRSLGRE